MNIATTCVRCGKRVQEQSIYCTRCEKILKGEIEETLSKPSRSKPRIFAICLAVTGIAILSFLFFTHFNTKNDHVRNSSTTELPENSSQQTTREPNTTKHSVAQAPPEQNSTDQSTTTYTPLAKPKAAPKTSSVTPAPEPPTDNSTETEHQALTKQPSIPAKSSTSSTQSVHVDKPSEPTQTSPSSQPLRDTETATKAKDQNAAAQSTKNGGTSDKAPTTAQIPSIIWVYYANNKGDDLALAERLRDAGFAHAAPKGKWNTINKLNYLFHRNTNSKTLRTIQSKIKDKEFSLVHVENGPTSKRLRKKFADNSNLDFLLIVQ